jgi:hypothetical protein
LYSGLVSNATHTGDATGSTALTVVGLRGVTLPALGVTAGLLKYTGTGTNTWVFDSTAYGTGSVTSVSGTGTVSGLTLTGTVTTTGNLTLGGTLSVLPSNFASQTANTFLAAPNGAAGAPTFRTIVAADIPTLNQNTTGTAANSTLWNSLAYSGAALASSVLYTMVYDGTNSRQGVASAAQMATFISGQTMNIVGSASTITGVYGGTLTSSQITTGLGFTPYNSTNPSGYITSAGSISGNAASATYANTLYTSDTRTISPSSHTAYRATFGFTSWANNNTSPYADYFNLRSYSDSSGGNDNLIMFRKDALGIRIWQQTFGSATAYASYKDVAWTDGTNASGTWGISVTGSAGSVAWTNVSGRPTAVSSFTNDSGYITSSGSISGNAATATNISNTGTVTLASATESNSIYVTAPSYTTDTPVKLLNFDWYSNIFSIGNIRSGATPSNGFGVYYTASGGSRTEIARFGTGGSFNAIGAITQNGNQVLHAGNYTSYSPSLTGTGASGTWGISVTGNAATAGGFTPSQTSGTANRIVVADANGYIVNNYFYASGGGSERNASGMGYFAGHNTSDYYYRSYTAAAAAALLSGQTMNIAGSSTSCTGNAATVTNATFYRQFIVRDDRTDGSDYSLAGRATGLYAINSTGTNGPGYGYLSLIHVANSTDVAFQIAGGYNSDAMYFRGTTALQSGTGYSAWRTVIHSGNIGSQSVSYATTSGALTSMNISQFTNNSVYITGITSGNVTTALGYTPYNSTNPSGYITNTNGAYYVTAGEGNGVYFWQDSTNYTIKMGVTAGTYQYGPVTDYSMRFTMGGGTARGFVWGYAGSSPTMGLNASSGNLQIAGTFTEASSIRYKDNVADLTYTLEDVLKLRSVTYTKKGTDHVELGFIAEEVNDIIPEAVMKNTDGSVESISYGRLTAVLLNAVKEQQKQIDELKALLGKYDTGHLTLPVGTSAQRPTPANGMIRYNSDLGQMEAYVNGAWTTVSTQYTIEFVLVAGGGAGGGASNGGGGGGGGGVQIISGYLVTPGTGYSIVIGGGGGGVSAFAIGTKGSDSTAFGYTSYGGGGGNYNGNGNNTQCNGGSGGGGGRDASFGGDNFSAGSGIAGQGNWGGQAYKGGYASAGGGGGAAGVGGVGGDDSTSTRFSPVSEGGVGALINWTGTNIYYGPGGGGAFENPGATPAPGGGGLGDGGGTGATNATNSTSGTANRGAGGGGTKSATSGGGGSGRCIIRYYGGQRGSGGTVTSNGGYTIHTFDGTGTFTA